MLAEGDMSADPTVRIYDDVGDKKNMRFRYIGEWLRVDFDGRPDRRANLVLIRGHCCDNVA
jgi:hypothetical protein